jgi:hypothetical protein
MPTPSPIPRLPDLACQTRVLGLALVWDLGFGIWYLVFGIWYLVFCIWYLVFGVEGVVGTPSRSCVRDKVERGENALSMQTGAGRLMSCTRARMQAIGRTSSATRYSNLLSTAGRALLGCTGVKTKKSQATGARAQAVVRIAADYAP